MLTKEHKEPILYVPFCPVVLYMSLCPPKCIDFSKMVVRVAENDVFLLTILKCNICAPRFRSVLSTFAPTFRMAASERCRLSKY